MYAMQACIHVPYACINASIHACIYARTHVCIYACTRAGMIRTYVRRVSNMCECMCETYFKL